MPHQKNHTNRVRLHLDGTVCLEKSTPIYRILFQDRRGWRYKTEISYSCDILEI